MSSTNQIYNRTAKRRGDKFDQSMTRSKLLENNTTLFIFYFYSNDEPRYPESYDRIDSRNDDSWNGNSRNQLQPVELEGVGYRLIYHGLCLLT